MADATEWLYRIQATRVNMLAEGLTPDEQRIVGEHFEYLRSLAARGVLVLAGRTLTDDEHAFGIVIFKAANEAEARAVMTADPAIAKGLMRAELFPYRVALLAGRDG